MSAPTTAHRPSVLLVTPGYPPTTGGVEGHVAGLATNLVALGWEVDVLTSRRGVRRVAVEQREGVRVTVYPAWSLASMSVSPRLLIAALRAGSSHDVVHVHSYHASTGLAALRRRSRLVFTPHYHGTGHTQLARLLHRVYRHLGRRCFAHADAIVCVSQAEEQLLLADHPVAQGKTSVIPNGVDVAAVLAAPPFEVSTPTVLSLGRVEPYKHVDVAVEAFASVAEPARLVVVGTGSALPRVRELVTALGLGDRVDVLGFTDDEAVNRWRHTARVLVSLSDHEAFGMAPLEAAAGGARVVLSDIAAHREIAEKYLPDRATLLDHDDPAAIAAAIEAALAAGPLEPAHVPTWRDVAVATAVIYRPTTLAQEDL